MSNAANFDADLDLRPGQTHRGEFSSLPVFCLVVFIIDLCFMLLRGLMAAVEALGVLFSPYAHDAPTALIELSIAEASAAAAMALLGFVGSGAMLARRNWGVGFAVLKVVATLVSMGVECWHGFHLRAAPAGLDAPQLEMLKTISQVTAIGAVVVRMALLGVYIAAVVMFMRWSERHARDCG